MRLWIIFATLARFIYYVYVRLVSEDETKCLEREERGMAPASGVINGVWFVEGTEIRLHTFKQKQQYNKLKAYGKKNLTVTCDYRFFSCI